MADGGQGTARTRLVVLFGGRSAEHEISCISASHVLRAASAEKYDIEPIGITRDGRWVSADAARAALSAGGAEGIGESVEAEGTDVEPSQALASGESSAVAGGTPDQDRTTVVLPILHGPMGEDGTIQGLLELSGVPYVGSGVLGSALAMDKVMAKTILDAHGLAQTPWRAVPEADLEGINPEELLDELGPVVFVKPANMGSSIGVTRVADPADLLGALREALTYDDLAVVESAVEGREIECGVLGNDHPEASVVGEIIAGAEFYDYNDKYFDDTSQTVVPADVAEDVSDRLRDTAIKAFRALRCEGMARVDMFLVDTNGSAPVILVNEVNTIPGFTPISMYPKMWDASGVGYPELIDRLVELAIERHARRSARSVKPA